MITPDFLLGFFYGIILGTSVYIWIKNVRMARNRFKFQIKRVTDEELR